MANIDKIKVGVPTYDIVDTVNGYSRIESITNTIPDEEGDIAVNITWYNPRDNYPGWVNINVPNTTNNYGMKYRVRGYDLLFENDWDGSTPEYVYPIIISTLSWEPAEDDSFTPRSSELEDTLRLTETSHLRVYARRYETTTWKEIYYYDYDIHTLSQGGGYFSISFKMRDQNKLYDFSDTTVQFFYDEITNTGDWTFSQGDSENLVSEPGSVVQIMITAEL